jgi:hypothetical protein
MKKLLIFFSFAVMNLIIHAQGFVSIDKTNNNFKLNGSNFYPLVLNYNMEVRKNSQNHYWITPSVCYGNYNGQNDIYDCNDSLDCLNEIQAQFQMIRDMGFNAVRLGISPTYNNDYIYKVITNKIYLNIDSLNDPTGNPVCVQEEVKPPYNRIFSLISDVLNEAADRKLKVILVCGGPDTAGYRVNYANYLVALANNFKNNTALLAYDLFNEPEYSSKMIDGHEGLSKCQISDTVGSWISRMKAVDNNHLITIGFATSNTVFSWDPGLIPVDFASFHPYPPFDTNQTNDAVENEIYWYVENLKKLSPPLPWIIGETGLPADNIKILYQVQRDFAESTLDRCINCGGYGYSYWQYKDVFWDSWADSFQGLLNSLDSTKISDQSLPIKYIKGSPKPAVSVFQTFSSVPTDTCPMDSNYYNINSYTGNAVSGIVTDVNNNPIGGVVITGENSNWGGGNVTFTKPDGTFTLYCQSNSDYIRYLYYSYLKMTMNFYDLATINNSNPTNLNNITINIGQSQTYNSSNSINVSNFYIQGDGVSTGGSATMNAPLYINFNSGTKVDKGGYLFAGARNITLTSLPSLTSLSSCSSLKSAEITNEPLVEHGELNQMVLVYPNPSSGIINIKTNINQPKFIELFDTYGKNVYSTTSNEQLTTFNLSHIPKGIYVIKINTNKNIVFQKLILQ